MARFQRLFLTAIDKIESCDWRKSVFAHTHNVLRYLPRKLFLDKTLDIFVTEVVHEGALTRKQKYCSI